MIISDGHDVKQPAAHVELPACRLCMQELEVGQMQKVWIQSQTTFASVAKNEDGHFCCKVGSSMGRLQFCCSLLLPGSACTHDSAVLRPCTLPVDACSAALALVLGVRNATWRRLAPASPLRLTCRC